jgi:hypothetical protein
VALNWNQEVSLSSIKNIITRGKSGAELPTTGYPTKTWMNLYQIDKKTTNLRTVVLSGVLVLVCLIAVLKFGVFDQLAIVSQKEAELEAQQELLLAPGAALGTLPGVAVEQGQTLYVKVEAVGGEQNAGGFYELSINGTVPSAGSGLATQNNRAEEAMESAADGSSTRGWVGAGDACDFYRVEMANAGSLSLALGELESGARVRIYEQREDGTLAQLQSIAVRSGSELDRTLNLTTGSYFVEVASLDNGAGMHNTAYSLALKKEEEEQQNSSGLNLA